MNFDVFEKKAKELGVLGIVVTKDGKEIGKKLWDEQCRRNVYSASKSFTSTAVGIAGQGKYKCSHQKHGKCHVCKGYV